MTRLSSIGVTKSQQRTTFDNDKATIHWSNRSQQQTTFHNDKATIHWSNKSQQRTTFHNDKATIHWSNKSESSLGTDRLIGEVHVAQIKRPATCCYEKELQ